MWNKNIEDHFKKHDPLLHSLTKNLNIEPLTKSADLFISLAESIVSQQLSIKASDTIFGRFKKLFPKEIITPKITATFSLEKLRTVGVSGQKANYIQGLASMIVSKKLNLKKLHELSNEEVITELTKVKGIGTWTAEMFCMFALGREDVFSYGDLGLRKAMQKLYSLKKEPTLKQAEKITKKWSPYRTHASRLLWRSLEIK